MHLLYFAYGSNLSIPRIRERVPSAMPVTKARLIEHQLRFHKKSHDGSAKCDAFYTGDEQDVIHGVVYEIHRDEKATLDLAEGLGNGYEIKTVQVLHDQGPTDAFLYYATHIDANLQPYHWYKEYVIAGAQEHGLPQEYIEEIHAIESVDDPQEERVVLNRDILQSARIEYQELGKFR